ncbi:cytochrome p450 [Trifolium pratense]|uniref:Cytochrome p450 n=1 Tax=Trifolium pratense TaxID=57577 RepID=A0A2K3LC06_TRIPR|nr:cytochrome p450 [Trifolium pratense]
MHMLGVCTMADAVPILRWMKLGVKAMKETAKELDIVLDEWLVEHHKMKGLVEKVESDQDFMDMMISMLDGATINGFDADTINKATTLMRGATPLFGPKIDFSWSIREALILGATDTSTVTLTWVICLLLRNPLVLEKAKEELNIQIGEERFIVESDINKLIYLQAIVKETLRLYPPGPLSAPREFTEDCNLGGYHIKKGTRLITNLWKIHTDPSIWPDPLEFKPERFLTTHKDIDAKGQHFELLPFGSGRRICPGISFGLHMIHLTLANFLHSFEISNGSSEPVDMTENLGMTNEKATPLEILVKPHFSHKYYETM